MIKLVKNVEGILFVIILVICLLLGLITDSFFTIQNFFDLLNNQSVNIIMAAGLLVVLVSGGIDISFSVAASVVQYVTVAVIIQNGGGNWLLGTLIAMSVGTLLGLFNAFLIHRLRIISIIATIGTFNLFFGLLMYLTRGRSIYNIPDWLDKRVVLLAVGEGRSEAMLYIPVLIMGLVIFVTWIILAKTGFGRQIYGFGSDPEAARRSGVRVAVVQAFAYGWLGLCAGIAGLMQAHMVREVVPNAFYGRELDVLASVVLGGAILGGGRGSVSGAVLGVMLLAVVQNGLNLMGITPFAFKAIVGVIILISITFTNISGLMPSLHRPTSKEKHA
ncbi:MAG: ABC transporter permease [Bacteroidota bacterium]